MGLYPGCSNYSPGLKKTATPKGSLVSHRLIRENWKKIFLCETRRLKPSIFGMELHLLDLYHDFSNDDACFVAVCSSFLHLSVLLVAFPGYLHL